MADNRKENLRVPPHDIEAEKALLGAIMLRPVSINDVLDIIAPDSFYIDKHGLIFKTMVDLVQNGDPIDVVSVTSKLKKTNKMKAAGGASYIAELTNSVPSSANIGYYAKIVSEKYTLRNLIGVGDHITELGFNEKDDINEILNKAEKDVFGITSKAVQAKKFVGIKELIPHSWERMEKMSEFGELRGVPTGFQGLDDMLAGFQKSDLIILAARPSMGKTSLALDIARRTALQYNTSVGFFSVEMSAQQLVDRMLSAEAQVDAWRMRTGKGLTEDDFRRVSEVMGKLSKAPIYIDDQPGVTVLQIRSTARRLKSEYGLDLIIVDYLQLMSPTKNYDSMVSQITEISRSLKSLARELEIPVLALSQLSRAVEQRGGRPRLSDLRDSGAIEQDADVVMFIHREDKYHEESEKQNVAEILIQKHRNGATGKIELYFDEARTTFMEIDTKHTGIDEVESIDEVF